jgi:hypothetical protein
MYRAQLLDFTAAVITHAQGLYAGEAFATPTHIRIDTNLTHIKPTHREHFIRLRSFARLCPKMVFVVLLFSFFDDQQVGVEATA